MRVGQDQALAGVDDESRAGAAELALALSGPAEETARIGVLELARRGTAAAGNVHHRRPDLADERRQARQALAAELGDLADGRCARRAKREGGNNGDEGETRAHGRKFSKQKSIFRANLAEGTALGVEAKKYMDAGEYVPDSVTNNMVRDRLKQADAKVGFLLDGYPRTVAQVAELDGMLGSTPLDKVIELTADTDEVVRRLLNRAQEQGRADDTEEVIYPTSFIN